MAVSRARRPFSDRLTSRGGAWLSLGVVVLIMVALFGVFGSAKAPTRNDQAPAGAESTLTNELMAKFPDVDRQSVLVIASRDDGAKLPESEIEDLEDLLPVLDAHADANAESSGPMVSDDGKAAVLITPIKVGETNTDTAAVIKELQMSPIMRRWVWPCW